LKDVADQEVEGALGVVERTLDVGDVCERDL